MRARKSLGLKPPKAGRPARRTAARLGQHFLMHARIAERIARVAGLPPDSVVLEIGPGKGILTRELLKLAGHVVAVEADTELCERLRSDFATEIAEGRLELICGDIRSFALGGLPPDYVLVANIPYYITGEILRLFLESEHQPRAMTLLVQKEVAERIARARKESILSLSVKAYGKPTYEFTVPRGAFKPAPKVDSAVLSVRGISREKFSTQAEEKRFFELLHAGFAHKRKLVRSNLKSLVTSDLIPPQARAEDLPLATWLAIIREKSLQRE